MAMSAPSIERSTLGLHSIEQYEPLIGTATTQRILRKAERIRTMRIAHVSLQLETGGMEKLLVEFARHADRSRFALHFG